jgi:hypothetical protein
MKKRGFGMTGFDYTGTRIALNFVMKGLTYPNFVISEETRQIEY